MNRPPVIVTAPPQTIKRPHRHMAWIGLLGLGLVGLGAVASIYNPDQTAYEAFLSQQALQHLETQFCPSESSLKSLGLEAMVQQGCQGLLQQGQQPLQNLIRYHTTRINLGIVSLYCTELPGITQAKVWAVGFMGHIYLLP